MGPSREARVKFSDLFKRAKKRPSIGRWIHYQNDPANQDPDFAWGLKGEFGALREMIFEGHLKRLHNMNNGSINR